VTNHLGLDFDLVELLTGVDTDDGADHLGDNDHVTEVSLDLVGLLVGLGLLLCLAELLDQTHGLALKTTVETSAGTGVDDIAELLRREVEELVKVDTTVGELLEGSLGLEGCCGDSVSPCFHLPAPLSWPVHRVLFHCAVSRRGAVRSESSHTGSLLGVLRKQVSGCSRGA
jgi:hypothetical protein